MNGRKLTAGENVRGGKCADLDNGQRYRSSTSHHPTNQRTSTCLLEELLWTTSFSQAFDLVASISHRRL